MTNEQLDKLTKLAGDAVAKLPMLALMPDGALHAYNPDTQTFAKIGTSDLVLALKDARELAVAVAAGLTAEPRRKVAVKGGA